MKTILALITARGGSKGLPGKHLRLLRGKPLVQWSIDAARRSASVTRTVVSTDDEAIAAAARAGGAEVPFLRPAHLAQDSSPHIAVAEHALEWLHEHERFSPDYLLLLQPTSPLRTSDDIDAAAGIAGATAARAVVGVCEPEHHPFALKQITAAGTLADFMPSGLAYGRRQDYPPVYAVNGAIYLVTPAVIREERTFEPPDARPYVMPRERSVDIDTLADFERAEALLSKEGGA